MSIRSYDLDFRQGVLDVLYGETSALVIGAACILGAALLCYAATGDVGFAVFAVLHGVTGIGRGLLTTRYHNLRKTPAHDFDRMSLARWRIACVTAGALASLFVGLMAGYAVFFGHDTFAMLVTITIALAGTTGTVARSFGSSLYVHLQVVTLGLPACVAMAIVGTTHERLFTGLFALFFISVGPMAGGLRVVLHRAILKAREVEDMADDMGDALETMPNGLLMFDRAGKLKVLNSHAAEVVGLPYPLTQHSIEAADLLRHVRAAFDLSPTTMVRLKRGFFRAGTDLTSQSTTLHKSDGSIFEFRTQTGTDHNLVIRIDDVTQSERDRRAIIDMARTDALTGLANRSWFFEVANGMRAAMQPGDAIWVAVINLNAFKHLNEVNGAATGDTALQHMAKLLRAASRPGEVCARTGGDEFLVAAVQRAGDDVFEREFFERFDTVTAFSAQTAEGTLAITASIGICIALDDEAETTSAELLARADYARLEERDDKAISLFKPELLAKLEKRRFLREALTDAVQTDAFHCEFQPIVSARLCRVEGFEALCRWTHPTLGPISPGEFIPIAEETGLITQITHMQLRRACAMASRLPDNIGMSVNLSALDLRDDNILDALRLALDRSALAPHRLTVEVTETSMLDLRPETLALIAAIRDLGVKVALDDFGTGFSSLSYLHAMPLDRLKVDRSFIKALDEGEGEARRTLAVLTSVVALARALDMDVVLEGVEHERQLDTIVAAVDADLIQGFLYAKPMSESRALAFANMVGPVRPAGADVTDVADARQQAQVH